MPNYQYKCRECNSIFDIIHSITETKASLDLVCTSCASNDIFRYLGNYGSATVIFKGIGWASKDAFLDKLGMPKATQQSPEAREQLKKL
jgi:putative FmdB family regulatory protein